MARAPPHADRTILTPMTAMDVCFVSVVLISRSVKLLGSRLNATVKAVGWGTGPWWR